MAQVTTIKMVITKIIWNFAAEGINLSFPLMIYFDLKNSRIKFQSLDSKLLSLKSQKGLCKIIFRIATTINEKIIEEINMVLGRKQEALAGLCGGNDSL